MHMAKHISPHRDHHLEGTQNLSWVCKGPQAVLHTCHGVRVCSQRKYALGTSLGHNVSTVDSIRMCLSTCWFGHEMDIRVPGQVIL